MYKVLMELGGVMQHPVACILSCIKHFHHFLTAQALAENTTLTHLELSWCAIGVDGMPSLSSLLRNKSSLESLDLSWNKFGSKGAEILGRVMLSICACSRVYLYTGDCVIISTVYLYLIPLSIVW